MNNIVEFRAGSRARNVSTRSGVSAEIVLFPGVRYERWGEAPPAARSRQRDTLELAD